jgi:hypothetical protein
VTSAKNSQHQSVYHIVLIYGGDTAKRSMQMRVRMNGPCSVCCW